MKLNTLLKVPYVIRYDCKKQVALANKMIKWSDLEQMRGMLKALYYLDILKLQEFDAVYNYYRRAYLAQLEKGVN